MKIQLPKNKTESKEIEIETDSLVIVGANGSGKTKFAEWVENITSQSVYKIPAVLSLSMPDIVSPTDKKKAEDEFENKGFFIKGINTDFDRLMVLLHTKEYESCIQFTEEHKSNNTIQAPITKLDRIQNIFEYVILHRKLVRKTGSIEAYYCDNNKKYNASEMSDGEKMIFYTIGKVICMKENSLIIIDEPENHLHKSIVKKLWDKIEQERPDCTFMYLTHDIDFAVSRQNSKKIWMKSYDGDEVWDYEILNEESPLPEQLYLEILGSRKPILFIEGELDSLDYKLYEQIFRDHTVKPLGSCDKVFEATSSFNDLKGFHHLDSFGLIDRDRRTEEQISHISDNNIWVSKVAEVESFLLLEDIIKIVAKRMGKNETEIFTNVQKRVINEFKENLEREATQYTLYIIKNDFEKKLNPRVDNFSELHGTLKSYLEGQNFEKIYNDVKAKFEKIINVKDYNSVLKVYNNKGLLHVSQVALSCDINTKNNAYLNQVISILKTDTEESQRIRESIINMIYRN